MGTDTPIAVLSERPRLLFDYFQQLFAQVTNPPLDAIREEVVTAVASARSGRRPTCCSRGPRTAASWRCRSRSSTTTSSPRSSTPTTSGATPGSRRTSSRVSTGSRAAALRCAGRSSRSSTRCQQAIDDGARVIVLSDRNGDEIYAPIPSLLLTSAVHHHLIRTKQRTKVGLIVECGDAREVHHMALLIGYGAGAINPYLAFESIEDLIAADEGRGHHGLGGMDPKKAVRNYIKASGKGVLKVMWKMGVSTVASYTGAQIFEAIGLGDELIERVLHRHRQPPRRDRSRRAGGRDGGPPRDRQPDPPRRACPSQARARRRVPVATRGRAPPVQPRDRVQVAARHAGEALRHLQGVHLARRRPVQPPGDVAWPVRVQARRSGPDPDRRRRTRDRDPQAVLDGRHVVRLDLGRGARDAGDRDELDRRQVATPARAARTPTACTTRHGARRSSRSPVRPLRRHVGVPHQRRRSADQDGAGCQARRRWAAAGAQGVPVDRQDPPLDARRRSHQPPAAPRHLLDRGSEAADPRPQELQSQRRASTSSSSPRWASARSPPVSARPRPTSC